MMERYLLILLAVLLAGSIGAFFLYMPILPTIAAAVIPMGLAAMFWLGFRVGHGPAGEPHERLGSPASPLEF